MGNEYEEGLTLNDLFKILLEKWWIILISVVVCFAISAIYSYYYTEDYYQADSSMIVQVTSTVDSQYTNLMTGENLVDTYAVIATSHQAIFQLKEALNLPFSDNTIKNMISVNGITNTLIIELEVKSTDPVCAANMANTLVEIVKDLSQSYEGLESVEILDTADIPTAPAGPNRLLNMIIGFMLGGILGCGTIFIMEVFDRNIKTKQDVEQHLNIRVLGAIPDYIKEEGVFK